MPNGTNGTRSCCICGIQHALLSNMRILRVLCLAVLFFLLCLVWNPPILAQSSPASTAASPPTANEDGAQPGWLWTEGFEGSSDSTGTVTKFASSLGYNFTRHFGVDLGVPVYFVRTSSSTGGSQTNNGIGNAFVDARLMLPNSRLNYYSTLTGGAPTGDSAKGLSTGRATVNWDNRFDHSFDRLTPFADLGLGNTIPDTHFRQRPFTSLGFVSHFEAGGDFDLLSFLGVGASGYAIVPEGQQKIFSKFVKRGGTPTGGGNHNRVFETAAVTTGPASIARDDGFSGWVDIKLKKVATFELGYSRSLRLDLNTVSFGVIFNLSPLLHGGSRH